MSTDFTATFKSGGSLVEVGINFNNTQPISTGILDNPSLFNPVPESSRTIFTTQVNPSQDNPSLSFL